MSRYLIPISVLALTSCSITRPCTEGGDVSWTPGKVFDGDMRCYKKRLKPDENEWVNHGKFIHFYRNGQIGLHGMFRNGKKHGMWVEFNEAGERKVEKYFEDGVEKAFLPKHLREAEERSKALKRLVMKKVAKDKKKLTTEEKDLNSYRPNDTMKP